MALMEADGMDPIAARNALAAMINRSQKTGEDLGTHVSKAIYQPTIEPSQQARLERILKSPQYGDLTTWAERRAQGLEADPVGGATHLLAHEPVMERLRAQNPQKYRSWVNWTGYNAGGGKYSNPDGSPVFRDASHAFLAPEGFAGPVRPNVAMNSGQAGVDPDGAAGVSGAIHTAQPRDAGVQMPQPARQPLTGSQQGQGMLAGTVAPDFNTATGSDVLAGLGGFLNAAINNIETPKAPSVSPPSMAGPRVSLESVMQVLTDRAKRGGYGRV